MIYCIKNREGRGPEMKKILAVILAVVSLLALALPAGAAYVSSNYSLNTELAKRVYMLNKNEWIAISGIDSIRTRRSGSNDVLFITGEGDSKKMSASYEPRRFPSIEKFNELSFDVKCSTNGNVNYSLTYYYGDKSFTDTAENVSPERRLIRFRIPEEAHKNYERMVFTVSSSEDAIINSCTILAVHGDDFRSYSYIERFASNRVEMPPEATDLDDCIEVVPAAEGSSLKCILEKPFEGDTVLVTMRIYSPYAGILTVKNEATDKVQTTAMYRGEATYCFIISGVQDSITVGFSAGEASGGKAVRFISLSPTAVTRSVETTYGTVESCIFDGKKVTVKGSIPSETAVKYIKSRLALYRIPYDSGEAYELSEPIAEMRISTSFTLSAAVDYDHTRYRYVAAIVDGKKILPISSPYYAFVRSERNTNVAQGCEIGLSETDAVSALSAKVGRIVLDADCNKLIRPSYEAGSIVRITYHDKVFYLDGDQINQLASQVEFYTAAGIKVYLRVTDSAEEGSRENQEDVLCAAASYLAEKFPELGGMILSAEMNKGESIIGDAAEASRLLALFKGAIRNKNTDCRILASADPDSISRAVMMAYYNKLSGVDNVDLFFECSMNTEDIVEAKALFDSAAMAGSAYRSLELYCGGGGESAHGEIYSGAVKAGVSAVVFSAAGMDSDGVVGAVEEMRENKTTVYEYGVLVGDFEYAGECSLWDFKGSYDTFGWLSGGSCLSPQTVRASLGEGRAMRSIISPRNSESGVLIRWFDGVTDISFADHMRFSLYTENTSSENIPLKVVLGAGSARAEYKTELVAGESTVTVDLGGFAQANKLDYVALILEARSEASVEIADVSLLSERMTDDQLKARIAPRIEPERDMASVWIFFGAVLSSTVIIFAVLTKKKNVKK